MESAMGVGRDDWKNDAEKWNANKHDSYTAKSNTEHSKTSICFFLWKKKSRRRKY